MFIAKLDNAQKRVFPDKTVLVLIQDMKTQLWLMYKMLARIVDLEDAVKDIFKQEF